MVPLSERQVAAYDKVWSDSLSRLVFGSNYVEEAGLDEEISARICKEIFEGKSDHIELSKEEYEDAVEYRRAGMLKSRLDNGQVVSEKDVKCGLRDVAQHTLAAKQLFTHMVAQDEPLTEDLIKATHRTLTDGIDAHDGDESSAYSGIYRTVVVTADFSIFTHADFISSAMERLTPDDRQAESGEGSIHPYTLASKYCHEFVNPSIP